MANEVTKLNGIAIANITNLNGITDANLSKINGQEFTGSVAEAAVTAHTEITAASGTSTGASMTYDEDNDFVYVQYPRNGGGGAAMMVCFCCASSLHLHGWWCCGVSKGLLTLASARPANASMLV